MKITKQQLEKLIKEAVQQNLKEEVRPHEVHEPKGFSKLQTKHGFSIALPRAITVDDYHEISNLSTDLNGILGIRVKVEELGNIDGAYVGIVYVKKDKAYQILKAYIQKLSSESDFF